MTPQSLAQELLDNRISTPDSHLACLAVLEAINSANLPQADIGDLDRLVTVCIEQHSGFARLRRTDEQHLFGLRLALTAQAMRMVSNGA